MREEEEDDIMIMVMVMPMVLVEKNNVVIVLEALIHNEVDAPPHCIPSSTEQRYFSCQCLSAQHGLRHNEPATAD